MSNKDFELAITLLLRFLILFGTIQNPHAYWDSSTSSTVEWFQFERTCLYWQADRGARVFVNCYPQVASTIKITFGHEGSLSGDLRPSPNGRYILQSATETIVVPLEYRKLYLPLVVR